MIAGVRTVSPPNAHAGVAGSPPGSTGWEPDRDAPPPAAGHAVA
jgi:hypothetical protein